MHWGATTQDITDTATVLQIREALALVQADLTKLANALAKQAKEHRLTPVIGRSNLQQAIPMTFGYKMAGVLSAVQRHQERVAATGRPACWWANCRRRRHAGVT